MKIQHIFLALLSIIIVSSCGKDKDPTIRLNFTPNYGDQDFELGNEYFLEDSVKISFLKSEMYLSNFRVVGKDNKETQLSEIEFLKFDSPSTVSLNYENVDVESPKTLKFGIGVPADLNSKVPEDFAANHPLNNSEFYWEAWDSYIFTKTEGQYDTDDDDVLDNSYVFHTGSDTVYQEVTIDLSSVSPNENNEYDLNISLDHKKMLNPNGVAMDIDANPVIHTSGGLDVLYNYVNAIKNAISLKK